MGRIVVAQHGRKFGRGDVAGMGADFALGPAFGIEAHEHDAGAGVGWMQCKGNRKTGMDADTRNGRTRPKRGLFARFHDPVPQPPR